MSVQKNTISSIFMLPTLKINRDQLLVNNFINAFYKDPNRDMDYGDCVYLLFKPKDFDRFEDFVEGEYVRTKQMIDDYDYDNGLVVLVYLLDSTYKADFDKIRKGKYSKTSPEFQALFPKIIKSLKNGKYQDQISVQFRIFNKDEALKAYWEERINKAFTPDMEVYDGWDDENEILNIEKVKNYV
jgi:hypothetical protein